MSIQKQAQKMHALDRAIANEPNRDGIIRALSAAKQNVIDLYKNLNRAKQLAESRVVVNAISSIFKQVNKIAI